MGENEESGVVFFVVGDVSGEDLHAVEFGGSFAGDGCGVEELLFFDDFDAACGVVGWDDFPSWFSQGSFGIALTLGDENKLF